MPSKQSKIIHVECDCELKSRVQRLARRNNITPDELIRQSILVKLPEHEGNGCRSARKT